MNKTKLTFLCAILFLSLSPIAYSQQSIDPFSSEGITAFADDLFQNGFLTEAETEYKRSLFLWESSENQNKDQSLPQYQERAIFTLTAIYNTQNNKDGLAWLSQNYADKVAIDVREKIDFVNCRFLFLQRNQAEFNQYTQGMNVNLQEYDIPFQMITAISSDLLAKDITSASVKATAAAREFQVFNDFAKKAGSYNTKSPVLATVLSIFIPGSGKLYTGSFTAFLSSFLSVSSFVAGTIFTGIESDWKSWKPFVIGSCGLILYVTDIYGSYQSAKRYNDAQYRILCESLDTVYEEIF